MCSSQHGHGRAGWHLSGAELRPALSAPREPGSDCKGGCVNRSPSLVGWKRVDAAVQPHSPARWRFGLSLALAFEERVPSSRVPHYHGAPEDADIATLTHAYKTHSWHAHFSPRWAERKSSVAVGEFQAVVPYATAKAWESGLLPLAHSSKKCRECEIELPQGSIKQFAIDRSDARVTLTQLSQLRILLTKRDREPTGAPRVAPLLERGIIELATDVKRLSQGGCLGGSGIKLHPRHPLERRPPRYMRHRLCARSLHTRLGRLQPPLIPTITRMTAGVRGCRRFAPREASPDH